MNVRLVAFSLFIFFPLKLWAQPVVFLKPNLNKAPKVIPSGTKAQPWCLDPKGADCIRQWSNQAVPMTIYSSESSQIPSYQFFLPILIPSKSPNKNPKGEHWRPYLFSSPSAKSKDKKPQIRYEINALNQSEVRIVNNKGKILKRGRVIFVSLQNIDVIDFNLEKGKKKPKGNRVGILLQNLLFPLAFAKTRNRELFAFSSRIVDSNTNERSSECFTAGSKTEADFCFECEGHPVLSEASKNAKFLDGVNEFLEKSSDRAKKQIRDAVPVAKEGGFTKICMSDNPLGFLMGVFDNKSSECQMKFNEFYPHAYCEACKRSIPPEIMLGLMSIESSARCNARAKNDKEDSFGLFQINAEVHGCYDHSAEEQHPANSDEARKCLKNPINNLIAGTGMLRSFYQSVNPTRFLNQWDISYQTVNFDSAPTGECQSWSQMDDQEKDRWRKATAAYNSGSGWVVRAIKSVKIDYTSTDKYGDYYKKMSDSHEGTKFKKAQQKYIREERLDPSWEAMRIYFFTEKLLQKPSLRPSSPKEKNPASGRQLALTLSNMAYVESILGRNVDQSYPGMVDIWGQYINKNRPKCPPEFDDSGEWIGKET